MMNLANFLSLNRDEFSKLKKNAAEKLAQPKVRMSTAIGAGVASVVTAATAITLAASSVIGITAALALGVPAVIFAVVAIGFAIAAKQSGEEATQPEGVPGDWRQRARESGLAKAKKGTFWAHAGYFDQFDPKDVQQVLQHYGQKFSGIDFKGYHGPALSLSSLPDNILLDCENSGLFREGAQATGEIDRVQLANFLATHKEARIWGLFPNCGRFPQQSAIPADIVELVREHGFDIGLYGEIDPKDKMTMGLTGDGGTFEWRFGEEPVDLGPRSE